MGILKKLCENLDFYHGDWNYYAMESESIPLGGCEEIAPPCAGATLLTAEEVRENYTFIPGVPDGCAIYDRPFFHSDGNTPVLRGYDYKDHWWTRDHHVVSATGTVTGCSKHFVRPALLCDLSGCNVSPGEMVSIHNEPYVVLSAMRLVDGKPYCLVLRMDVLDYTRVPGPYRFGTADLYRHGGHSYPDHTYEGSDLEVYVNEWFDREFRKELRKEQSNPKKSWEELER